MLCCLVSLLFPQKILVHLKFARLSVGCSLPICLLFTSILLDLVLDTDTQQNLAELSISDEASDGRSAQEDADSEPSTKEKTQDDNNTATESRSIEAEIDKVTQLEITVLEGSDDKRMETGSTEGEGKINKEEDVPHQSIMDT